MAYHKPGVPCVPTKWWLVPLSVEQGRIVVPKLLAQDKLVREGRMRLQQLCAASHYNANSMGYAPGLTHATVVQHESNILDVHSLVFHILLARHLNKDSAFCTADIGTWVEGLQVYTQRLHAVLQKPSLVTKQQARKELKMALCRKPHRLIDQMRQLVRRLSDD